jgi:hypothetical protein
MTIATEGQIQQQLISFGDFIARYGDGNRYLSAKLTTAQETLERDRQELPKVRATINSDRTIFLSMLALYHVII